MLESGHEPKNNENVTEGMLTEQLDAIIDSSFDAIWLADREGRVIRINKTAEQINDIKAEQVLNRKMEDLAKEGLFEPCATIEVLRTHGPVKMVQQLKNGRQVLVTGTPVFDKNGQIDMVIVNGRDITELNSLKSELEESRALSRGYQLELSNLYKEKDFFSNIVVRSESMRRIFNTALKVAQVASTVLIQGESGVGKGLFANLIHRASKRNNGPFIRVDCGAIPESLIESELFGYEEGAFTGARLGGKPGHFEMAKGGTLFLDDIGELPLNVQVKLLRFLEQNEVVPVGGTMPKRVDARIIAATSRDLEAMVKRGLFRGDLFFRLSVVPLKIPSLWQRADEIPHLVHFFLKKFNQECSTSKVISPKAVDCITRYPFPGNIRELANLIEQLVVLSSDHRIKEDDLPSHIRANATRKIPFLEQKEWDLRKIVERSEKETILRALEVFGSQRRAAGPLGVHHSTLVRKVKKYALANGEDVR